MAGEWIPWEKGLARKPEVLAIAKATGLERREVAGTLMEFWEWCDSNSANGELDRLTHEQLPEVVPGTDAAFWIAVATAGWLGLTPTGLVVPHFGYWLGKSAKRRLKDTRRKQTQRCVSAFNADKSGTRVEESRVEESTAAATALPPTTGDAREAAELAAAAEISQGSQNGQTTLRQPIQGPYGPAAEPMAELALIDALVKRGLSPTLAKRHAAETADPALIREILAYHDAERGMFHKPAGALRSMLQDPARWGFELTTSGWTRPPPSGPAPKVKTTEDRAAEVAASRAAAKAEKARAATGVRLKGSS